MSVSTLLLESFQGLFDKLPQQVQRTLLLPTVQKGLALLATFQALRTFNGYLSRGAQNNWTRVASWEPSKELVLLTGGASGIGKQIMKDLAQLKVKIIIIDVQEPDFALPSNVFFYRADITSSSVVKEVAGRIRKDHGDPTILINNAGVGFGGTILSEPEEQIRLTVEVNLLAHFWTVREFLPSMIQKDHGHIITIASLASFVTLGETVDYASSKAAALAFHEGLTQEIRHWYKSKKIRTSIIHPLWVRTPLIDTLVQARKHFKQPVMSPEKVSSAVVKQIVSRSGGQVIIPSSYNGASLLRGLPNWIQEMVRDKASMTLVTLRELENQIDAGENIDS
ncbi:putative short-chain dehydrogenases/reductase [Talaromyces proteolyticus]|uniref:Short-chain dehydrogenase/reductase 3 n=1 Tax=Talaromyces proteolyticus TaxID=1131652 RepID=A0AAD4L420_9EURO|nr:putative short-chain dehydrogenases/reductase [Talaromyces proteolyticus]KAH8704244.1 putative short-chain dehydrogenases/reductase [Talaromyces proteolyticus]